MRAAGLLPLLPLLLLLGVSSQEDTDPGQTPSTQAPKTPTMTLSASTTTTSPPTPTPASTTLQASATAMAQPTVTPTNPAQSISTITSQGTSLSPSTTASPTATDTTPTTTGTTLATNITPAPVSGQDSSSHSATNSKTSPATSTPALQPPKTMSSSGSLSTTATAKSAVTETTNSPEAAGAAGTSSPFTETQGNQPLDQKPNTAVSTPVPTTALSQSPSECAVPPSQCDTKQPPPSSSSAAQEPIPSTSPGSTKASVTPPTGSLSPTTTSMSPPGSKDTVPEATTTTAPGADQSTHDAGHATAKPSQSPASAQPPAPGSQTDQAESCTSGQPQPNISSSSKIICAAPVQHTRPTIHLKEPRSCVEWKAASKNNSFYESFCSTAQHVFDASRDQCTVTLMACDSPSHLWAVQVVLHLPLDSGEVLMELKEKKDRLEELGIINITFDKMVEDMTIKDEFSTPLIITIITLAGSLLLVAAIYGCHQRFSQKKDQNIHPDVPGFDDGHVALIFNRLTEEMQTMENGYHDNPTLEVMETSSEMQEKKVNLNGELGDSWIVPLDTLMKEDLEEEEDTHL
ncbi:podocalyxin [Haemorhous mexicanus]|uniref:podocalyxin n=1 Tax=Haemorhous mexicanus TaxID=30427 RepID=UPI0028BD84C3|nr:podocalyxin [Haemorhous mexicanus]